MRLPTLITALLGSGLASAASLTQVPSFGSNPSNVKMYIYVPDRLAPSPPVIVAIHYCTGTANAYYTGTPYARLADQHGFIVIYPESPYSGGCWDVSSSSSLTRNGGGNSNSIANMVTYVLDRYSADRSRVFVTGTSSGAMMTNVMAATYPDLFQAGSVYNGVPAGCFYTGTVAGWNNSCAEGKVIASQDYWRDTALNMAPGYQGSRPRMLINHGGSDTILYPPNFNETMKQWSGVFGYTYGNPQRTLSNNPSAGYTRYIYGPFLEGVYNPAVGHSVPVNGEVDLEWFGITGNRGQNPGVSTTTSTSRTSTPAPTTSTTTTSVPVVPTTTTAAQPTPTGCTAARWGQCAGNGFTGCRTCASPYKCTFLNDWYSQCL